MQPRFQFNLGRALASIGLIVAGLAMWPMMGKVDSAALPICLITLPIAGVGCFVGKTIAGFALGLVAGVLFHLNYAIS